MDECSDISNTKSRPDVQVFRNARSGGRSYKAIVLDWYLAEWLKTTETSQADLVRLTDYPKAKVSDLVNGKQRYNRDILNDIAKALNVYPFELLMHPEDAMANRRLKIAMKEFATIPFGGLAGDESETEVRKAS